MTPSLGVQAPIQTFSIFSLFMSLSSLLPYSRELILSLWRPGVFCCCLKLALQQLFCILMRFLCICGEAGDLPVLFLYHLLLPSYNQASIHFEMHRNIEPLCCETGTNIVLQVSYTSKANSQEKRSDLWFSEVASRRRESWMKAVKRYKLRVVRLSARDVVPDMINIINTAICYT